MLASPIYASIPDGVILGNKAYDMRYLFNKSNSNEINTCLQKNQNKVLYKLNSQTHGEICDLLSGAALTDEQIKALPFLTYKAIDGKETMYEADGNEVDYVAKANVTVDTSSKSIQVVSLTPTIHGVSKFKIDGTDEVADIGGSLTTSTTNNSALIDLLDSNGNILFKGTLNISDSDTDKMFKIVEQFSPDSWFIFADSSKTILSGLTTEGRKQSAVFIPNSVKIIYNGVFDYTGLTTIIIPESVEYIDEPAFQDATKLTSIDVAPNNLYYCDIDGILYNKNKTEIVKYPQAKKDNSFIIPGSVTTIGDGAFDNCAELTTITIPNSVSNIEEGTFRDCKELTTITIPNSVSDRYWSRCVSIL